MWKVANDVIKPRNNDTINLVINGTKITDELEVAESFNNFFVKKIADLKEGIDPNMKTDPLEKLAKKQSKNELKFKLKKVTIEKLKKSIKRMKNKKSAGVDALNQQQLILSSSELVCPLSTIINESIMSGVFPAAWKEAQITPVLKKGDTQLLDNYRPVSCLPAASKLLESVVNEQMSNFLEINNMLPQNQYGFRPHRSTMTA